MNWPPERGVSNDPIPSAHPTIDVRVVLFTLTGGDLLVAVQHGNDGPRVPRDLPNSAESLDATARRIIAATTPLQERYLEQLYTLSVVESDGNWTIIVSYLALFSSADEPKPTSQIAWQLAGESVGLSETDRMVIDYAVVRLRAKLGYTNIAFHLLPPTFTLTELQTAYETILGRALDKRNFRRRMIASGILIETGELQRDRSNRPASLYSFRAEQDAAQYLTPPWAEPTTGANNR
jgi:8-oxo-dGTP diphosphatase